MDETLIERNDVREVVRRKYGEAALTVLEGRGAACCGGNIGTGKTAENCCGGDVITGNLYGDAEAADIPEAALLASLGCGNPTALAELRAGETVLDLGSGGGIDVLLSARRVGPTGFAYGLDMTDEMLALAEKNKAEAGARTSPSSRGTSRRSRCPTTAWTSSSPTVSSIFRPTRMRCSAKRSGCSGPAGASPFPMSS
jgi:2-polyprenyl-3-methyl-5-hydroxy-6-metoxy-1,4-benzoquinol methylase